MRNSVLIAVLALPLCLLPAALPAADYVCDRSDSKTTPSPDGRWHASVQEEVCETSTGAAAGITVNLVPAGDPDKSGRVFIMPVPRAREDWPRIRWLGADAMEIRVPNLSGASPPEPQFEDIRITLAYCGDNPVDRARLTEYKSAVKQWQSVVSAWAEQRKTDPQKAGPRPPRPEEPKLAYGHCPD